MGINWVWIRGHWFPLLVLVLLVFSLCAARAYSVTWEGAFQIILVTFRNFFAGIIDGYENTCLKGYTFEMQCRNTVFVIGGIALVIWLYRSLRN